MLIKHCLHSWGSLCNYPKSWKRSKISGRRKEEKAILVVKKCITNFSFENYLLSVINQCFPFSTSWKFLSPNLNFNFCLCHKVWFLVIFFLPSLWGKEHVAKLQRQTLFPEKLAQCFHPFWVMGVWGGEFAELLQSPFFWEVTYRMHSKAKGTYYQLFARLNPRISQFGGLLVNCVFFWIFFPGWSVVDTQSD